MDIDRFLRKAERRLDLAEDLRQEMPGVTDKSFTEDVFYEPKTFNFSYGADLEQAYRFKKHYPLLHRHGLPVPFAMDDFDPKTQADAKIRLKIAKAIQDVRSQLADEGLDSQSDAYQMALAKSLFDWAATATADFLYESDRERPDWQAFLEKSGKCTERSTILYYIYKEAGLDPSFFLVDSFPPTLSNYFSLREDTFTMGHAFIGFWTEGEKRWVFADLLNEAFDGSFPRAVRLTPRQYVQQGYLTNLMLKMKVRREFEEMQKVDALLYDVAPLSCVNFFISASHYFDQNNLAEMEQVLEESERVCSSYPLMSKLTELRIGAIYAALEENGRRFLESVDQQAQWMETVYTRSPALMAKQFFFLGETMLGIARGNEELSASFQQTDGYRALMTRAKDFWMRAIEIDPQYLPAFWRLQEMYQRELVRFDELFQFLDEVATKEKGHAVAHYLAAYMGLRAVERKKFGMTGAIFQKIIGHIETVFRLDPDFPAVQSLRTARLFFEGRLEEVVRLVEKIKKESRAVEVEIFYHQAISLLGLGRREEALAVLRELLHADSKVSLFVAEGMERLLQSSSYNV
ncbi:MAG: hypothetical protein Q8P84_04790, partial [Deltaproteobacteria bacterium]|nr:hypothetical protein [Deltaproteobacteria bacterium]